MREMFLYEYLTNHDKKTIDNEIRMTLRQMILDYGFDYSENQFASMINLLVIHNTEVNKLIGGNGISNFDLKTAIVTSKACEIAYGIEHNKPTLEPLKRYVTLCIALKLQTYTETFFNKKILNDSIRAYEYYLKKNMENIDLVVDFDNITDYTKSSNIIWFVEMMNKLFTK